MKIGLLYGGKSTEHEVSIRSAISVYNAIDKNKHEVVLININKHGHWLLVEEAVLLSGHDAEITPENAVTISPAQGLINASDALDNLDVIFPILHGQAGEDGSVQGLLQLAGVPYVGCGILSSAMCMDKDVTKKMLESAGLSVASGETVNKYQSYDLDHIASSFGFPLFIKPANQGSSVGVTRVDKKEDLKPSLDFAFKFDHKVLIEQAVKGREIEVAVLGNNEPISSVPGEVVANTEFYSYESKYIDENGASLMIPAELTDSQQQSIREIAVQAYRALGCEGLSRVDVFLTENDEIIINEINTLPGFTSISMYPKLFEVTGIPYSELIDRLLEFAVESFKLKQELVTDFKQLD